MGDRYLGDAMEEQTIKLPVFRTFFRAAGFTIWNGWTIFRLTWFPTSLMFLVSMVLPLLYLTSLAKGIDLPQFEQSMVFQVTSFVLQMIATASAAVAIHRVILFDDRQREHYFLFAFGRTEILYLLMAFTSLVFTALALAAVMVPFAFLISGGDPVTYFKSLIPKPGEDGNVAGFGALFVTYIIAWIVTAYFMLRLSVWPPAVVATNRFALGEAWRLTKGNVLRLLGLFLLPVLLIWMIVVLLAATSYFYLNDNKAVDAPATPPAVEQNVPTPGSASRLNSWLSLRETLGKALSDTKNAPDMPANDKPETVAPQESDDRQEALAPSFFVFMFFFMLYATAYGVAILSFAYKSLKGFEAGEPIPVEA